MRAFQKVAIVRFSSLGDIVLTTPILTSIKKQFPGAEIVYVTKKHFADILRGDPRIDMFIELDASTTVFSLLSKLRAHKVDAILDLHGKWRGLAARWSHPLTPSALLPKPSRIEQFLVRRGLKTFRPKHSIVERYFQAADKLFQVRLSREALSLHVTQKARDDLFQVLSITPATLQNSVLIAPGAQWETKRWPIERHIEVARVLRDKGIHVVACGSPTEAQLLQLLAKEADVEVLPQVGLDLLPALIASVRAFIGHDSGPMHIARALGTPTLAIFGSTPSSQFEFTGHQLVENPQRCSPCHFYGRKSCPQKHFACMESIEADQVLRAFEQLPTQRLPLVSY